MKRYSAWQFAAFRLVLGIYLAVHFAALIPYAAELFSRAGMLPEPRLQPTFTVFPNLLTVIDSPLGTQLFLASLVLLAGLFAAGCLRRPVAILLWYGWACLLNRNVLIANPGIPYVGWLLLACALLPAGEPLSPGPGSRPAQPWVMPPLVYWGAWFLMAAGYTLSGLHKLQSPSWVDGSALAQVLRNPLARVNGLRELLLRLPPAALKLATWMALGLEISFLPLSLVRAARRWIWLLAILLHAGILGVVNVTDLTLGVLMIHLFTFDAQWVGPAHAGEETIVFFDGVCGLCNRFVYFTLTEDRERRILFAPLQGSTARRLVDPGAPAALDSIVLAAGGKTCRQASAVLGVFARLGGLWRVLAVLGSLLPRRFLDRLYRFVARHRYRWFGQREACRLPNREERTRFLD